MPDQTQNNVVNIGDEITPEVIRTLPVGAVIADVDGDTYERIHDGWLRGDGYRIAVLPEERHAGDYFRLHRPYMLKAIPLPDPYQEARLALRDVLGMEPDEQMIRNTMDTARQPRTSVEQAATLTAGAAKLADAEPEPAHEVAQSILIVTALGADTGSRLVVSADTTAGLARLRAHSALDALLDQHGISR